MKKITTLTKVQADRIPEFRDRWLSHGLSTRATDRAKSEDAVRRAYAQVGLKPPKIVVWLSSPMAGAYGSWLLAKAAIGGAQVEAQVRAQVGAQVEAQVRAQVRAQVGDQVREQVWDQVWDQVRAQVWAQVGDQVGAQVRAQVWDQVGDQVRAQVGDQVRAQVWAQVGDQVRAQVWGQVEAQVRAQVGAQVGDQVRAQVWDQVWRAGYGLQDAGWLALYDYFGRAVGLDVCERLRPLMDLAEWCGWWWPFAGAVVMTEKPVALHRDERGRLHNESAAAISYSDGWGVYAVHGVRVPADVIERPESVTVARIEAESNAEIRRVMVERYGRDRYVKDGGFEVLHEDRDELGFPRRLLRKRFNDARELVLLEATNSSPEPDGSHRVYHLGVHPEIRPLFDGGLGEPQKPTCLNAVASLAGMTGAEYRLSVQT